MKLLFWNWKIKSWTEQGPRPSPPPTTSFPKVPHFYEVVIYRDASLSHSELGNSFSSSHTLRQRVYLRWGKEWSGLWIVFLCKMRSKFIPESVWNRLQKVDRQSVFLKKRPLSKLQQHYSKDLLWHFTSGAGRKKNLLSGLGCLSATLETLDLMVWTP